MKKKLDQFQPSIFTLNLLMIAVMVFSLGFISPNTQLKYVNNDEPSPTNYNAPSTPTNLRLVPSSGPYYSAPKLCWDASIDSDVGDTILYQVTISGSGSFQSLWASTTCLTPTSLGKGSYSWTVHAKDSHELQSGLPASVPFVISPKPVSCYALTLTHAGNGADPTASPTKSSDCTTSGSYVEGESITLTANPASGYKLSSWTGIPVSHYNMFSMPATNTAITANYVVIPPTYHAPSTPTNLHLAPPSGPYITTPQLCWDASSDKDDGDALFYQVSVSGATSFLSDWINSTCITPTGLGLGSYIWTVRAKDSHELQSDTSTSGSFEIISDDLAPGLHQENDPLITYSGTWFDWADLSANDGNIHYTFEAEARAVFHFKGSSFTLYRTQWYNRGIMQVCIDGMDDEHCQSVDNSSATILWDQPVDFGPFTNDTHWVTIINPSDGTYLDIDAILIK